MSTTKNLKSETLRCLREDYAQSYLDQVCKSGKYAEIPGKERVRPMHLRVRLTKDMFRTSFNGYVKEAVTEHGCEIVIISDMYEQNHIIFPKTTFENTNGKANEMLPLNDRFIIDGVEVEKKYDNGRIYYLPVQAKKQ